MHFTVPEGLQHALQLREDLVPFAGAVDLVVLPPAVMLWEVANALRGSPVTVGAQNASWADEGPFTGEISPRMLAGWCEYLLIGHSERRQLFRETDEELYRKVQAALRHKLKVILAVGETLEEYEAGRTAEVITRQVSAALYGVDGARAADLSVAYEPVWAIGTGRTATPDQAQEVTAHIKTHLCPRFVETPPRVLYGGSVTAVNAASLFAEQDIDGALVGGASLRVAEFATIVAAAAEISAERS